MVYVGWARMPKDDPNNLTANDFTGKDLTGKIAVIDRGTVTFATKLLNAEKAGAIAAIVIDNVNELQLVNMEEGGSTIPSLHFEERWPGIACLPAAAPGRDNHPPVQARNLFGATQRAGRLHFPWIWSGLHHQARPRGAGAGHLLGDASRGEDRRDVRPERVHQWNGTSF